MTLPSNVVKLAHNILVNNKISQSCPLLIIHGLFGMGRNWQSVSHGLLRTYSPIICLDLRNHGSSPWHDDMSIAAMTGDVAHVITQELKQENSVILGHSLGGKVAMYLSLTQPKLVNALIVVDSAPTQSATSPDTFRKYLGLMKQLTKQQLSAGISQIKARQHCDKLMKNDIPEKSIREFLLTNLLIKEDGTLGWKVNIPALLNHLDDIVSFPTTEEDSVFLGPVAFIGGSKSNYIKAEDPELTRLFPRQTIQHIEGAGHWVHADKPTEFIRAVSDFLILLQSKDAS